MIVNKHKASDIYPLYSSHLPLFNQVRTRSHSLHVCKGAPGKRSYVWQRFGSSFCFISFLQLREISLKVPRHSNGWLFLRERCCQPTAFHYIRWISHGHRHGSLLCGALRRCERRQNKLKLLLLLLKTMRRRSPCRSDYSVERSKLHPVHWEVLSGRVPTTFPVQAVTQQQGDTWSVCCKGVNGSLRRDELSSVFKVINIHPVNGACRQT